MTAWRGSPRAAAKNAEPELARAAGAPMPLTKRGLALPPSSS
jgi:hypothetical protein